MEFHASRRSFSTTSLSLTYAVCDSVASSRHSTFTTYKNTSSASSVLNSLPGTGGTSTPYSYASATCAYPSWPGGRSFATSQRSQSALVLSGTSSTAVHRPSFSSYSQGASAFLTDEDLLSPECDAQATMQYTNNSEDCIAPGYHGYVRDRRKQKAMALKSGVTTDLEPCFRDKTEAAEKALEDIFQKRDAMCRL